MDTGMERRDVAAGSTGDAGDRPYGWASSSMPPGTRGEPLSKKCLRRGQSLPHEARSDASALCPKSPSSQRCGRASILIGQTSAWSLLSRATHGFEVPTRGGLSRVGTGRGHQLFSHLLGSVQARPETLPGRSGAGASPRRAASARWRCRRDRGSRPAGCDPAPFSVRSRS